MKSQFLSSFPSLTIDHDSMTWLKSEHEENDRSSQISSFLDLRINHLSTVTSSQEIQLEDARVLREDSVTSQAQGLRRFLTPGFPGTPSKRAPVFSIEKKGHEASVDVSRYGLFMGNCWISEAHFSRRSSSKRVEIVFVPQNPIFL